MLSFPVNIPSTLEISMLLFLVLSCNSSPALPPVPELPPIVLDAGQPSRQSLTQRIKVLVESHPDPLVSVDLNDAVKQGVLGIGFTTDNGVFAFVDQDPTVSCHGVEPFDEKHVLMLNPWVIAGIDNATEIVEWWAIVLHEATHLKQARARHRTICGMLSTGERPPEQSLDQQCAAQWARELEGYATGCRFANAYGVLREYAYCASVDSSSFSQELYGEMAKHDDDKQNAECLPTFKRLAGI